MVQMLSFIQRQKITYLKITYLLAVGYDGLSAKLLMDKLLTSPCLTTAIHF